MKIIILDYSTSEVSVFNYDPNVFDSYEDFYEAANEEYGTRFSDSQCSCMVVSDLNIKIH